MTTETTIKADAMGCCPGPCKGAGVTFHHDNPADLAEWTHRPCTRCNGAGRVATTDLEHVVKTRDDMLKLSYFTLCKIQEVAGYSNPIEGIPMAISRGEYEGIVTTDWLGNFKAIR